MMHTYHKQNRIADALTRLDNEDLPFDRLHMLPPLCLAESLAANSIGNTFHRKVASCNMNHSNDPNLIQVPPPQKKNCCFINVCRTLKLE